MTRSPAEVVGSLIAGITAGRWTELAALYATDTVVEHPLLKTRLTGRQALEEHFARASGRKLEAFDVVLHETTDPEVVIAEYGYRFPGCTTANVQVVRVRDGLITHSRDYHDHLLMAVARSAPVEATPPGPVPGGPLPEVPDGSPQSVLLRLLTLPLESRADLYAEDAYVTHPFHPGAPALRGRDELREHFAGGPSAVPAPRNVVFHQGIDPEMIVTEFTYTGDALVAHNIFVSRVSGGRITESRDYADHVAFAAAAGRLPELVAAARSALGQAPT
ncbi:nuclear transport factor 2 family protein [Amycolatopsis endophytica]|uniref:Ketosteroid isomerase-like protein n=1 Tax=Amycolatopsis endophytica TaxID=860233 RepID=A0A853AWN8_9PSEU|nr:nuclear transport factor 2 family protein [Amycolatopsis endophytica]NYI87011.1 ketosteroid isomerase-like protein [Amycolatopsis endophytica]